MKIPYIFHYHSPPVSINHQRPNWSTIRFPKAQDIKHLTFKNAELSSQVANFKPFYIELLEFNNKSDFDFQYEVTSPRHFLFLLIKGNVSFYTAEGLFVSYAKKRHFALTYNNLGTFNVRMKRGNYTALCINIDSEWFADPIESFPAIRTYLNAIANVPAAYAMLPYCPITKEVDTSLKNIHSKLSNGAFYIKNFLTMQVYQILNEYETLAKEKQDSLPYQVRSFIHDHLSDPDLSSHSIAGHFGKVERSLRDQFKTEFNITIHDYFTHLRVRSAIRIMKENDLGPLDVFLQVGFKEVNTLRYHLEKFKP